MAVVEIWLAISEVSQFARSKPLCFRSRMFSSGLGLSSFALVKEQKWVFESVSSAVQPCWKNSLSRTWNFSYIPLTQEKLSWRMRAQTEFSFHCLTFLSASVDSPPFWPAGVISTKRFHCRPTFPRGFDGYAQGSRCNPSCLCLCRLFIAVSEWLLPEWIMWSNRRCIWWFSIGFGLSVSSSNRFGSSWRRLLL